MTECREITEKKIKARHLGLWLDQETPVSLAGYKDSNDLTRIAPVYTPPAYRGKGYARAVTAHLCQTLLNEGKTLCLNANAAERGPNKIYQSLGFKEKTRMQHYRLDNNM